MKKAPNDKPADPSQQADPSNLNKRRKCRAKNAKSLTEQLAAHPIENAPPVLDNLEVPDPFSEANDEVGES